MLPPLSVQIIIVFEPSIKNSTTSFCPIKLTLDPHTRGLIQPSIVNEPKLLKKFVVELRASLLPSNKSAPSILPIVFSSLSYPLVVKFLLYLLSYLVPVPASSKCWTVK